MATHRKVIRPGNQGFSDHRRTGQQLWNAIKNSRVQVQATSAQLAALDKITKLDAADPSHRLRHGLITLGTNGWTSVSTIKKVGTAVHAKLTIPADVARSYREAGIKLFLFTSRNESDSAMMIALQPYGSRDQRRGPLPALA